MMSKKYSITESRRCPGCGRKSYSTFLGDFQIYSYHCEKCGAVHSIFRMGSFELANMLSKNPQKFAKLTVADLVNILETAPEKPLTVNELEKRYGTAGGNKKKENREQKPSRET